MRKISTGKIRLKDIKHIENSRLREADDVGDLMRDIKLRGLLQAVGIRIPDNVLIYGNRRVKAHEKLGYDEIECDFFEDVSDGDLLLTNLVENMKRKKIGSIEIGRICEILEDDGMTMNEIGGKLGMPPTRVRSVISSYQITKDTPFAKLVVHGTFNPHNKGIPEGLIWQIQASLSRARKLTTQDWNELLHFIEIGELTHSHVTELRKILISDKQLTITRALELLKRCRSVYVSFNFDEERLNQLMKEEKFNNPRDFIKHIITKYDKKLIF